MSFVVIGGERYALPIGETLLGGSADDALPAPELAAVDPSAIVELLPDGTATLRATYGGKVLVDGAPMSGDLRIQHGLRVEVGGVALVFGEIAANGSTTTLAGIPESALAALGGLTAGEPTADTGGRLVTDDGRTIGIPSSGLTIGRDPSCGLPLADMSVSRRHATVAPSLQGYVLTDLSANGVRVNGAKVDVSVVLGMRDVIRVGDIELRFEADRAVFESPAPGDERVIGTTAPPRDLVQRRGSLFATLEVINVGPLHGTRFRIERPVVHVGRGKHNEVRLSDDSVSASHATLTRRGAKWAVLDLGSTNGTYVNGDRVTERALDGAADLRFGNVKLLFRPIAGGGEDDSSTRAIIGVRDGDV